MIAYCYKNVNDMCGLYTTNVLIMDVILWKYENNTCLINEKLSTKQITIDIQFMLYLKYK